MPAARGVKRTASKAAAASTASSASTVSKNKKKRGIQLEIPSAPKKRGRVLTCGQGDVGQLGLGENVIETTKFKNVTALGNKIVDACAGGMHTIALDNDGKVWTFGCNDEGALGRATSGETDEGTPKKVALPHPAVAVTAGDSHSSALLNNGDVYAWGAFRDSHGSMGLVVRGREGKPCREPVHIDIGEPAAAVASGGDHLVVLSTSGNVYTMGCGEQGQLGRLSQRSASRDARQGFSALLVPSKVTLKGGASRIWAGYHATFALDSNDKMFAWGLNNYGQLGITGEKRKAALFAPIECDAFAGAGGGGDWRAVSCGQHHSLALDAAGQVYAVGRCEYGRLGLGDRTGDAENLEPVPKLQNKKCVSVAAGTSNSFAVTDTGEIFAWGMGSEGQLGTGSSSDANEPTPAVIGDGDGLLPVHISAGGQHTVVFVEDKLAQKEKTPVPEPEPEEEKVEDATEEEEEEKEEVDEKPKPKRAKKRHQEEEISSTSNAQVEQVEEKSKPKKLNGDKKKDTPMEVDETDNPVDKKQDMDTETKSEDKLTEQPSDEPSKDTMDSKDLAEKSKEESLPEQKIDNLNTENKSEENVEKVESNTEKSEEPMEESQPETESSQDTTDTEKKSDSETTETVVNDVEMAEKPEINGTEETQIVETKSVDVTPAGNAITTTA